MKKPHILLLTADAGFGHRSASQAIHTALLELAPGACQVTSLNLVKHPLAPSLLRLPERQYDRTVTYSPRIYALTYQVCDTRLACSLVSQVMAYGLYKATCQVLEEYQPDAILSTFHSYQDPVLTARAHISPTIPFFTVITDLANVHQMWLRSTPDVLFVPTEAVRRQALAAGHPADQVIVSGIPVNPRFANEQRPPAEIRQALGWDSSLPVILVVGSRRTPHLVDRLEAINAARLPAQLAVVAGGDDRLYQRLQAIDWRIPVQLYNYVSNMPEMLRAANVLVTKAGGLITSEALACGLPLIFIEHIRGQETGNLEYVVGQGAGLAAESPAVLVRTLQAWLANQGHVLRQYAYRASRLGQPQAAHTIAARLWQTAADHAQVVALDLESPSLTRQPKSRLQRIFS